MKYRILSTLAVASVGIAVAAIAAPATKNWAANVVTTKAGSYVFGNPAAKAKLVEYFSYTCSHCAAYSKDASATLQRDYLAKGKVTIEIRHALRDPYDLAAALLARCDGPAKFLGHSEAIFANQTIWMDKGSAYFTANKPPENLTPSQNMILVAKATGLDVMMQKRGMAPAKITACLSNTAQQDILANMAKDAWSIRKISGTPSFSINNRLLSQTYSWDALKPQLDAAVK